MSDDIFDDIFDEADALQSVDENTTTQLSGHVRKLRSIEDEIADAEIHIKSLKQQKHSLADNEAGAVIGQLRERGYDPEQKTHIHAMTLKAFVRERIESGAPIDLDLFGAHIMNTAEIKRK